MIVLRIAFFLFLVSGVSAGTPYIVFQENGKAGVKSSEGKILIPAKYDGIGWSNGTFSLINNVTGFRDGTHWGLINLSNQRITKAEYTRLHPGDASVIIAGKLTKASTRPTLGCITPSGKVIVPFIYDGISLSSFRAIVFTRIGNQFRYGLIDLSNKTLIPQQYQEVKSLGTLRYAVRNFEGKLAVFGDDGRQLSGFDIDSLSDFRNNLALVYRGRYVGLMGRDGDMKLETRFREIAIRNEKSVDARPADEWRFVTRQNQVVRTVQADSVVSLGDGTYKLSMAHQTQLLDKNFEPVGVGLLTDIGRFQNGRAIYQLGSLFGLLQSDGKVILPAMYSAIVPGKKLTLASEGKRNGESWILFDSVGNRKGSRAYDFVQPLDSRFHRVKHRGFFGLVNEDGREVVACAYDSILEIKNDLLLVKFKGLYGVIGVNEEWLVAPRPNRILLINAERFLEQTSTSTVLKQRNGSVIYFTTNPVRIESDHLRESLPSGAVWKIDLNGVIAQRYDAPSQPTEEVYAESEGLRAIKRNGKYGFVDSRGRLRIANRYEAVKPFQGGMAAVKILGKWGFINKQDNIAVQPVYEDVEAFQGGLALVRQKGVFGVIDSKGKLVLPVRYQAIKRLPTGNLLVVQNGVKGLADASGRMLIMPKYEHLSDTGNGDAVASRDGKFGVIGYNGVPSVPMIYDGLKYDETSGQFLAVTRSAWTTIELQ